MNESASKASLASSGKPSTASSSVSPNGRKTRTIIVARNIPDDPAAVHPAPGRNGGHASTASDVVHQHHTRDARSGKLASYAALGGDEDVERFDQFLAEQRGQPRASELRAATTSPQHMLASMKRKTMSRLQLDVTDGKADAVVEDPAVRKQVQQELENDAKKRREEAVAHRKWLNSLPIHERVAQQRQQNALRKWRQMNHDWETFKARAARRLGKPPKELVMSRAASYREQREMYDALQKARPLSDKVGGDIWLVSLRNEGTRFVPVGNIFSGLFCPIRESTRLGPRVRRPLDYHNNPDDLDYETSRPVSKLERRSLQLLARKKWRLRKQLEALQPHEIQRSAGSHLAVGTSDLFAWAGGAVSEAHDNNDDAESLRPYSVHTDDKSSSRRRLLSQASLISLNSVGNTIQDEQYVGPSLRIAHVADDEDELVSNQEKDALLSDSNALTDHSPLRLSFYVPVGEQQQRSLAITNDGSTIVHYHWWRARFEDDSVGLTDHLRGQRSRKDEQELESCKLTSVSRNGGTLLPGETQVFAFTFQASQAGVFLEKWLLDAAPCPRIRYGAPSIDREAKKAELPVEVRLSCVAEDNFSARRRRQQQLTRVEQREVHFFVALLVDEIIDNVKPMEVVSFPELAPISDAAKFYEQNSSSDFGDVYFSSDLVRDLLALFDQAKQVLAILSPEPSQAGPQVDESAIQIEDKGGENSAALDTAQAVEHVEANAVTQEVTFAAVLPSESVTQDWDWCMGTLRELCKLADEAQLTRMKHLFIMLKKEEEVDEDNDENEDDDADEASDEDEDDADEDEDGNEVEKLDVAKVPKLTHRQIRESERLARCKALRDEIGELQPDLQERFEMLRFAGCTAPYNTRRLHERLHERIGSLCSETPVVCEIAKVLNPVGTSPASQDAKTDSVKSLLTRAIDEAIGGDMEHQTLFEQERRRLQGVWLHDQRSFQALPQHAANLSLATPPPTDTSEENNAPVAPVEPLDHSGIVLMHVDLDIAPWFSLVKAGAGSPDEVSAEGELVWRLSQDLLQHDTYVPPKVATVADALNKLIDSLSGKDHPVHTVVLVSELSRPPVTKKTLKLLRNAVRADMTAKAPVSTEEGGESEANTAHESNELEEAIAIKALLQRLSRRLSLRGIAQVLQRAVQKDVVFCSSFEEVHGQVDFGKKELLLSSSVSLGTANEVPSQEAAPEDQHYAPRIVLVDHLDAAGRELVLQNARKREALSSKPATPAPAEAPKAGAKKGSVAVASSRKPGTPGAATPAVSESSSPSQIVDVSEEEMGRQLMPALREQFARTFGSCVLDVIPSQLWESAFAFPCRKGSVGSVFAGPTLSHELETWAQILQPQGAPESRPQCITAIVGGKSLEAKLRFIDGLLEVVHEIYFVGEVAMSLYRVLHTKQRSKPPANFSASVEHEKGGNIEDDVDTGNDDENDPSSFAEGDGLNDEIPEEEGEQESKTAPDSSASKRLKGLWELLGPAVEKLQQKANRKCVCLFLPSDWIVGEVSLDEQDLTTPTAEDDDDEDDDLDEVEEEEETDRKRRKRSSEMKVARQKPLVEPDEEDVLDRKKQFAYEGERAHVVLNRASSKSAVGWVSFQDVTRTSLSSARVTEGKASVLTSLEPAESDTEEVDEEGASGEGSSMVHKRPTARFEYEWTFRAFDVGPLAMEALRGLIGQTSETMPQDRALVVNGVCGAVEFQEFSAATKTLVEILRGNDPHQVFIAGNATATWLHEFEIQQSLASARGNGKDEISADMSTASGTARIKPRKAIDDRVKRNSSALKHIIAAKPYLALVGLIPSA